MAAWSGKLAGMLGVANTVNITNSLVTCSKATMSRAKETRGAK
jgi:hypothetical protein